MHLLSYNLIEHTATVHTEANAFKFNPSPLKKNGRSVGEKRWTHLTFPMARPKCLMGDFTNFYSMEYTKSIWQMSDEPWKFFAYTVVVISQTVRQFFHMHFHEWICILNKISLKFVPIDNNTTSV